MVYANTALSAGPEGFASKLADAGAAAVIVPDLPPEESGRSGRGAVGRGHPAGPPRRADDPPGAPADG